MLLTKQFKAETDMLKNELSKKDSLISDLSKEVNELKMKVKTLEYNIDVVDQYERRDTVIISGPALPDQSNQENSKTVILNVTKEQLKINLQDSDVNTAHRIGSVASQGKRPMTVKLSKV